MLLTLSDWFRIWCDKLCSGVYFSGFVLLLILAGCKTDYKKLPAYSKTKQLQVVVLTPAGTNQPQQYNNQKKEFTPALDAGIAEHIKFLPYPGNWGFVPATAYRHHDGAESKPLELLVIAESQPSGTVQEVVPIATLILNVAGELRPIPVAVPARPSEQIIAATDFESFTEEYPAAKDIIQQWFLHYNPHKQTRLVGWKDEKYTDQFIRRHLR